MTQLFTSWVCDICSPPAGIVPGLQDSKDYIDSFGNLWSPWNRDASEIGLEAWAGEAVYYFTSSVKSKPRYLRLKEQCHVAIAFDSFGPLYIKHRILRLENTSTKNWSIDLISAVKNVAVLTDNSHTVAFFIVAFA